MSGRTDHKNSLDGLSDVEKRLEGVAAGAREINNAVLKTLQRAALESQISLLETQIKMLEQDIDTLSSTARLRGAEPDVATHQRQLEQKVAELAEATNEYELRFPKTPWWALWRR